MNRSTCCEINLIIGLFFQRRGIIYLLRPLTRFHTGGYYTNWNMGLKDPPTSAWINSWPSGRTQQVVLDG